VSAVSNQTYDYTKKNQTTVNFLNAFATAACGPLINHLTYNNVSSVHTPGNK
jgi:hypothetical protein